MTALTWNDSLVAGTGLADSLAARKVRLAMPVMLLIIAFMMPPETSVSLSSLRLSPYRVILLVLVVPSLLHLLSGKAGPLNAVDLAILGHSLWCILALGAYGGAEQAIESGGIYFVECFGAYAMGRRYIRSAADFQAVSVYIAVAVCVLLAFALPESVTHVHFLREGFRAILGGPSLPMIDPRMGLARAFGSFEHPILFGVFCSMAFGTAWYMAKPAMPGLRGWLLIGGIVVASFVSLSAGAWVMLGAQIALVAWDRVTRGLPGRWGVLIAAFIASLVVVSMLSNRSPVKVFIGYASFSAQSSYNRILIWEYGTAEVGRHPLLGIGLGEWVRAPWMSSSMDNFWLLNAVRYGLPALILLAFAILSILLRSAFRRNTGDEWARCRMAWITTIVGTAIAACTVHLWNNTFGFYLFIIGAGVWLLDPVSAAPASTPHTHDITYLEGDMHDERWQD